MTAEWIVVIEAATAGGRAPLRLASVRRLMERMADVHPTTLYSPDRYALQVVVPAASAGHALSAAVAHWAEATNDLGMTEWELTRAEVITLAEFERERSGEAVGPETDTMPGRDETDDEVDLLRKAFHDSLTGLANGELFCHHLEHALRRAALCQSRHALLLVDLDDFKSANQRLGHEAGDELLAAVAEHLAAVVRPGDGVGRVGGDEFAILLEDVSEAAAITVAERALRRLSRRIPAGQDSLTLTASVGIAMSGPGLTGDALLDNAATALARAKGDGPGCWQLYNPARGVAPPTGQPSSRAERRADLLGYLRFVLQTATAANELIAVEDMAQVVLHQVCTHMGWQVGHFYRRSECDELLSSGAWFLSSPERFAALRSTTEAAPVAPGVGLPGAVLETGRSASTFDLASDPGSPRVREATKAGLMAAFAFPVSVEGEVVGVFEFLADTPLDADGLFEDVMCAVTAQLGRVVERSQARRELELSEQRLRAGSRAGTTPVEALMGKSSQRISVLDPDGRTRMQFGADLLGHPYVSGQGLRWDLVHPGDVERAWSFLAVLMTKPGPSDPIEIRFRHRDGSWRCIELRGTNLIDDPDVAGLVITSRDVTPHSHLQTAPPESRDLRQQVSALAGDRPVDPTETDRRRRRRLKAVEVPAADDCGGPDNRVAP